MNRTILKVSRNFDLFVLVEFRVLFVQQDCLANYLYKAATTFFRQIVGSFLLGSRAALANFDFD